MKRKNLKSLKLNKQKVSQFEVRQITGGMVSENEKCKTYMKESVGDWCLYSVYASCYGPCDGVHASYACNGN
ncbi:hypothetical protein [Kordia sp.]|uniref:hypothetical protein n=1 Tax=Kordia sp. TaxID=1965332 RepID=UPI0025B99235|nr:hypothetical protein [Kordia sp.]MCH2195553.1 hypothetical protein [Kordia sp.]